jgi:hypothetical protein
MKLPKVCSAILATFTNAQEIVNIQCLSTMREIGMEYAWTLGLTFSKVTEQLILY